MTPERRGIDPAAKRLRMLGGRSVCGLVGMLVLTVSTMAAPGVDRSVSFVKNEAAQAVALLGNPALSASARSAQFRTLVLDAFDVKGIAQYVCGPYWDRATDAEKSHFLSVFETALARTYASRLSDYSGESVEISDARASGDSVVVTTSVTGASSQDVRVLEWKVLDVSKKTKLFDIVFDGVSTTETTREDYTSVLGQLGGKLDALTEKLQLGQ